jgi:dsRNA-specific ribonuclease
MAVMSHLGFELGRGTAPTKKQAEQIAAREAIKNM